MNTRFCAFLPAAALVASAYAGEPTIEKMAPKDTIFVMSVANAEKAMDHLKETGFWALWESEELAETREQFIDEFDQGVTEMFEELGVDKESLSPPTGALGMALFAVTDEDSGLPSPAMLACADYGDNADATAEIIEAMIAKAEEEGAIEFEEVEIQGRTARKITMIQEDLEEADGDAMGTGGMGGGMGMPDTDAVLDQLRTVHFLREGNTFVLCSNADALADALTAIDEDDSAGRLEERDELRAVRGHLGTVDGYAVLLPRDLGKLLAAADSSGMMFMMVQPVLPLVFGDVKAVGSGVRLDGENAMTEQSFSVYMPNGKSGLPALLDTATPRGDLPAFAGADAVSYGSFNFETDKLAGYVNNLVQSVPMLQMQAGEQLPQVIETIEQFTATLGTQVHVMATVRKPLDASSFQQLYAIECTGPEALEGLLAGLAPQMGLEPRDFLGHRIYGPSDAMMGGMMAEDLPSLGIGGGYLFVGQTVGVEQALRTVSGDGSGLAADQAFARATALLPSRPIIAWGFSQTVDTMEAQLKAQQLAADAMMQEMREQFPEHAAEFEQDPAMEMIDEMDFDLLRQYIGPTVWYVETTDEGFVGRSYQLSAGD